MSQHINYIGSRAWGHILKNQAINIIVILAFYWLITQQLGVDALIGATVFYFIAAGISLNFIKKFGLLGWKAGIPIFYLYYFIVLPVLLEGLPNNTWLVSDEEINNGYMVASVGLLGFAGSVVLGATRKLPDTRILDWLRFADDRVILCLFAIGVIANLFQLTFGFYVGDVRDNDESAVLAAGPLSSLAPFAHFTMLAKWSNYFAGKQKKDLVMAITMLVIVEVLTLPSTAKAAMLSPVLMVGVMQLSITKKPPIKSILFTVLAYFMLIYPIVSAYRASGLVDRARSGYEMMADYLDFIATGSWLELQSDVNARKNLDRGLLLYLSLIVEDSGKKVPYLYGESYMDAASIMVPRLLLPTKTSMNLGNVYAHRYGVLGEYDTRTNISPTYLGEQYMNFGLLGVLVGMVVMGQLAIWVDRRLLSDPAHWYLPSIILAITWQESFVGQTIVPFIKSTVTLMVIIYIANRFLGPSSPGNQPANYRLRQRPAKI